MMWIPACRLLGRSCRGLTDTLHNVREIGAEALISQTDFDLTQKRSKNAAISDNTDRLEKG